MEIPQLMGNCIFFQESCVVALDMYKYEQSNQFQYADSLVKLQEKWQAVAMSLWTYSTEECKSLDDISEIGGHLYMKVPKTLISKWDYVQNLSYENAFYVQNLSYENEFYVHEQLKKRLSQQWFYI